MYIKHIEPSFILQGVWTGTWHQYEFQMENFRRTLCLLKAAACQLGTVSLKESFIHTSRTGPEGYSYSAKTQNTSSRLVKQALPVFKVQFILYISNFYIICSVYSSTAMNEQLVLLGRAMLYRKRRLAWYTNFINCIPAVLHWFVNLPCFDTG